MTAPVGVRWWYWLYMLCVPLSESQCSQTLNFFIRSGDFSNTCPQYPRTLLPLRLQHETPEAGLGHHKVGCEDVHLVQWWHFGVGKQCPTLYSQSVHEAFKAMRLHFPLIKMRQLSPGLRLSFVTLRMWGNDAFLCSSGM